MTVKGQVARRGLCGDVFLVEHAGRAAHRRREGRHVGAASGRSRSTPLSSGWPADAQYTLRARSLTSDGRTSASSPSKPFKAGDLEEGRIAFTEQWMPDRLWDIHTPQNMYQVDVSLLDAEGKVLDTSFRVRFGSANSGSTAATSI